MMTIARRENLCVGQTFNGDKWKSRGVNTLPLHHHHHQHHHYYRHHQRHHHSHDHDNSGPIYVNAYGAGKVALKEVGHVCFKQMRPSHIFIIITFHKHHHHLSLENVQMFQVEVNLLKSGSRQSQVMS